MKDFDIPPPHFMKNTEYLILENPQLHHAHSETNCFVTSIEALI